MDAGTCEGQTGGGPLDSLLMLFQPFAGRPLGLGDLLGGHGLGHRISAGIDRR